MAADCLARWAIGVHPSPQPTTIMQTNTLTYDELERFAWITGQPALFTVEDVEQALEEQTSEYERIALDRVGIDSPEDLEKALNDYCTLKEQNADLHNMIERIVFALDNLPKAGRRATLIEDLGECARAIEDAAQNIHLYSGGMFANQLSLRLTGGPY